MMRNFRIIAYLALLTNYFILSYPAPAPASAETSAGAFPAVTKISDTVVDTSARTISGSYGQAINGLSFQQDAVVTHNGWQYVTYYNGSRRVCLSRRQLPSGPWERIVFTDYTLSATNNAHLVISMGICPNDGTIHLAFDHHGSTLHYRVSVAGVATEPNSITWSTSLFGPVRDYLEVGKPVSGLTYPRFWQTPDGNLQFGYRYGSSGDGDWIMVDYNGTTGLWSNTRMVISRIGTYTDQEFPWATSTKRNPYINNLVYGPGGKLHATWCWRETATGYANHDIMYAFSNDGGYVWLNGETNAIRIFTGTQGGETQTLLTLNLGAGEDNIVGIATGDPATEELITLDSPGVKVVTIERYYGLMNQQAQAVDPQGRIHTVMFHCTPETYQGYSWSTWGPEGARRYFHYWRDSQGAWYRNELPGYVGSRPKLFIRSNGDAFLIYQSRQNVVLTDTGIYFIDGDLTIQAATAAAQWTDWQIIHTETGQFVNEMLGDPYRFQQEEILSVMVQDSPSYTGQSTPLRIIDFSLN